MTTHAAPEADWGALLRDGRGGMVAVLCMAIWLHAADSLIAATTLPRAVQEIGGAQYVSWAFMLYELGTILAGAATGLYVARLGLRRAFALAALIYAGGCAVSALAPLMAVLLAGRLGQGVGGGWLLALTYVAMNRLFPERLVPKLLALIATVWSVSAFCGPLIGGTFANFGLWRFAFWAFAAQAGLFLIAVLLIVAKEDREEAAAPGSVPVRRLALLGGSVLATALAGAYAHIILSPVLCLAGLFLFLAFLRMDRASGPTRMFPRRMFDIGRAMGAGMGMVLAASVATTSFVIYGPLLLGELFGMRPLIAGVLVAVEAVSWGVTAVLFANADKATEPWLIRGGALAIALGGIGFALAMPAGPLAAIWVCAALQGGGFGMMWGFAVQRIIAAAPQADREIASYAVPTIQQIGYALGAALSGLVANFAGFSGGVTLAAAQDVAFWVFAAFAPLLVFAVFAANRLARSSS